jgi:MIP family channel proteins
MGIIVSGKVSGGHLNPAVSIGNLIYGNISILQFIFYIVAQILGAFIGCAMVFVVYLDTLNAFDGGYRQVTGLNGTAEIFVTKPDHRVHLAGQFLDQLFGTFLFILCNLAICDNKNTRIDHTIKGLLIGLVIYLIGSAYAGNSGGAVNPARDLAPRIFLLIAGWGSASFTMNNYFFWIPIVAPLIGSVLAALIYAFFIRNHWPNYNN